MLPLCKARSEGKGDGGSGCDKRLYSSPSSARARLCAAYRIIQRFTLPAAAAAAAEASCIPLEPMPSHVRTSLFTPTCKNTSRLSRRLASATPHRSTTPAHIVKQQNKSAVDTTKVQQSILREIINERRITRKKKANWYTILRLSSQIPPHLS